MIRTFLGAVVSATLGLCLMAAVIGGVGFLCIVGAKAAVRYHDRVESPLLRQVSCRWHDGAVTVSGVVENPNDGGQTVFVTPRFRLADGVLRASGITRVGDVMAGHASRRWRFVSSPLPHQAIRACTPAAWIDNED